MTAPLFQTPSRRDPRPGVGPLLERAKHAWRLVRHRRRLLSLAHYVSTRPALLAFARRRPDLFHPLLTRYLDRRLSGDARLGWIRATLDGAAGAFGAATVERLLAGGRVTLASLGEQAGTVALNVNPLNWHEGYFAVTLYDGNGIRVTNLSFGFVPGSGRRRVMFVGSVQGPGRDHPDGPAAIRAATRRAHGLRPTYLLLAALRALALAAGTDELRAIDPHHHMHGRWNHRHRLRFDYRAFWREAGGARAPDGHWRLPVDVPLRPLAGIPSTKRAMYRRRHDLLAELAATATAQCDHPRRRRGERHGLDRPPSPQGAGASGSPPQQAA